MSWNEGIVEDPFLNLKPVDFGVKMNVEGIEKVLCSKFERSFLSKVGIVVFALTLCSFFGLEALASFLRLVSHPQILNSEEFMVFNNYVSC